MAAPQIKHRYTGVEYKKAAGFTVNYNDVFVAKYFYRLLREWLVDNGYGDRDDSKWPEVFYLQKENPQTGKEIWLRWRLQKNPDISGSKMWRYDVDIDIHYLGLKETEITHKGKKLKMDKGEVEVQVAAYLIIDYEKVWESHKWLKHYKKFILNKLMKNKQEYYKNKLTGEMESFQDAMKEYLQLPKYGGVEFYEFYEKKLPE